MKVHSGYYLGLQILAIASAAGTIFGGCSKTSEKLVTPAQPSAASGQAPNALHTGAILQLQSVDVVGTRPAVSLDSFTNSSEGSSQPQTLEVNVVAKVILETLLKQEFLYGADLQYSSSFDTDLGLYNQSMAIGHIPARFRVAGNELQLVADNRRLFPSDVNHPEQLLSRFKIQSRTLDENHNTVLTISGANSTATLAQIYSKDVTGTSQDSVQVRDSWIRSFDFVSTGNFILQESSLEMTDGTIAEFMESIFPAETLAPGPTFQKIQMDPESLIGATEGPAFRYRLLAGETIFENEKKVAYAQHFDLSPKADGSPATLDFYVTANIPDEYIEAVKNGVEGWNRYFLTYTGIQRPVIQFKGKLPDGIHLGDPRYNVVAWDNRKEAGAAYESQATDPRTGKQSHTMIYLPRAWVEIGKKYWSSGQFADSVPALERYHAKVGKSWPLASRPRCDRDLADLSDILSSGRLSKDEASVFGVQTLTQTLFHEVGHSLGAAHNFKGSLSFDRTNPNSPFSYSIMDYNDYEIERAAFPSVHDWKGPLLEYDRQIMSTLYNQGKDVKDTDPNILTCADAEADLVAGGVDPLCTRYDIEKDPTHSILTALSRITESTLPNDVTLAQALVKIGKSFTDPEMLEGVKTIEDVVQYQEKLNTTLSASFQYYFWSGKASLTRTLTTNLKSLLVFRKGVLPDIYNESTLRFQTLKGLAGFMEFQAFPDGVDQALQTVANQVSDAIAKTPGIAKLETSKQGESLAKLKNSITGIATAFLTDEDVGLPKAKTAVFTSLKKSHAPYIMGESLKGVDVEATIVDLLSQATVTASNPQAARLAAATSLMTFQNRSPITDQLIKTAVTRVSQERDTAPDNDDRENAISLLKVLQK